jgi:predicted phage tail protein
VNHFLKKNLSNLQGAGGGGGGGGGSAPPPAELNPPKLGKLQTLSSYSYAEIIDLVSDGPIEGIVNQNGQYLFGNRIFEGIYFDNTPVKKSFDASYTGENPIETADYSLSELSSKVSGLWYKGGQYQDRDFTGVRAIVATGNMVDNLMVGRLDVVVKDGSYFAAGTAVNDPYVSLVYGTITYTGNSGNLFACPDPYVREKHWELTWNRDDIAKSIYKSIDLIKTVSEQPTAYGEVASEIAKNKVLRYNYRNWVDVKESLLPFPKNLNNEDYPVFAIKFEIGSPFRDTVYNACGNPICHFDSNEKQITVDSDFEIDKNTNTIVNNDIANQVFQRVELENLKSDYVVQPIQVLDLTYAQKTSSTNISFGGSVILFGFKSDKKSPSKESIDAIKKYVSSLSIIRPDNEKYNYSNVLSEIRNGEDLQKPLSYFNSVYVDREYGVKLIGPFDVSKQVLRVTNFDDDSGFSIQGTYEFPLSETVTNEGSSDTRSSKDFSSYAGNSRTSYVEQAIPITHVVENPNVDQVFVSIGVRALSDTNQIDSDLKGIGTTQAGTRIPTAIRFKLEVGLQNSFGQDIQSSIEERVYQVMGLVDAPAIIDIGRPEVENILSSYKFLNGTSSNSSVNAATAITLPEQTEGSKRFIRLTRTTYETSSSLVRREISLEKVTEVINTKFSYPHSAIIGTKIDSRTLSSIPPRSYDLRLKKILIPSNYYPLHPDGKDKRRYKSSSDFESATSDDLQIYSGNWDGTFKMSWSDNPAWVLFDVLINSRYGLGSFVDQSQINIWELYKIGRFCDAVNKNGVFTGVDNGFGGKEPRYSINVILGDKVNVFDVLNSIASVFRGNIFYSNSLIDFTDDRLKLPILQFNNCNVKDGTFSYTNSRKDQEFNVVEVSYLDESDNFKPKIEYVEDSNDIRKRGILGTTVDSFGVTSKALANRIGKHVLYSTIKENQAVNFIGGVESVILKPGDLISINDELKTQQRNFGKVLSVDDLSGKVYINEKFKESVSVGEITLFAPTGTKSFQELLGIARQSGGIAFKDIHESDVPQIQTFKISSYDNSPEYGSNVYISPTIEYPFIYFTGSSDTSGQGFYSGNGQSNGYPYYNGVTDDRYAIYRSTHEVFFPATPAGPPNDLVISFGEIETGRLDFSFNGEGLAFEFIEDGQSGDYFHTNVSSFSSPSQMAEEFANVLLGQVANVHFNAVAETVYISNSNTGPSAETNLTNSTLYSISSFGGGYGISALPSGVYNVVDNFWSMRNISNGNLMYSGASGETQPYSGTWESGTCFYAPKFDNSNRDFLSRVKQGSVFGITLSGVEAEIYKVNSLREVSVNEYEISAAKFDTGKFAEIESSQNLNDFYDTFSFVSTPSATSKSVTEGQVYQLSTPVIAEFVTGNYDGQGDSIDVSGSWSSIAGATSYLVTLLSPNGSKTTVNTPNTGYVIEDQSELGFYRLLVSAKNQGLGYSSRTASSGLYVFATETYVTPYIKSITIS